MPSVANRPWLNGPYQPQGPSLPFGGSTPAASPRGGWSRPPLGPTIPQGPPDWYNERPEWSMQPPPWYGEWGPSDPYNFRVQFPGIQDYNSSGAINQEDYVTWAREQMGPEWARNLPDFDVRPGWLDEAHTRPGWLNEIDTTRPGWLDESVAEPQWADQMRRFAIQAPLWMTNPGEYTDNDFWNRPDWLDESIDTTRPSWLDETIGPSDPHNLRSQYPGIQDYDNSGQINNEDFIVYGQEQEALRAQRARPDWLDEEFAPARPDWLDEQIGPSDPYNFRVQYPGIQDYDSSGAITHNDVVVYGQEQLAIRAQRERPEWLDETFAPARPDWMNEAGAAQSRPDWLDETIGPSDPNNFRSQYPGIQDYNNSGSINMEDYIVWAQEQLGPQWAQDLPGLTARPDWLDEQIGPSDPNNFRVQFPGIQDYDSSGSINMEDVIVYGQEQLATRAQRERPGWLDETIDTTRPDWLDEAVGSTAPDWYSTAPDWMGRLEELASELGGLELGGTGGTPDISEAMDAWLASQDDPFGLEQSRPDWLDESIDTTRPDWLDEQIGPSDPRNFRSRYPGIQDYDNSGEINNEDFIVYGQEQEALRAQRARPEWMSEEFSPARPDWMNEEFAPDRPDWLDERVNVDRPSWLDEQVGPSDTYNFRSQYPGIQDYDNSGAITHSDVVIYGQEQAALRAQRERPEWMSEEFAPARPDWLDEEFTRPDWMNETFAPARPDWMNEEFAPARPDWLDEQIGPSDPHNLRSQFPGIQDYDNSGAINQEDFVTWGREQEALRAQRARPDWLDERIDVGRPTWLDERISADRPEWLNETFAPARPEWLNEQFAPARPEWLNEVVETGRPGWLDEIGSEPDWATDLRTPVPGWEHYSQMYPGIQDYDASGAITNQDVIMHGQLTQGPQWSRDLLEGPDWAQWAGEAPWWYSNLSPAYEFMTDILGHNRDILASHAAAYGEVPDWWSQTPETPDWYEAPPWYAWNYIPRKGEMYQKGNLQVGNYDVGSGGTYLTPAQQAAVQGYGGSSEYLGDYLSLSPLGTGGWGIPF